MAPFAEITLTSDLIESGLIAETFAFSMFADELPTQETVSLFLKKLI